MCRSTREYAPTCQQQLSTKEISGIGATSIPKSTNTPRGTDTQETRVRANSWMTGRPEGTDRCFVKQLLCLYPFPHFSHFSSPLLLFPSLFVRYEPSLARRALAFDPVLTFSIGRKSSSTTDSSSSMASPLASSPLPASPPMGYLSPVELLYLLDSRPRLLASVFRFKLPRFEDVEPFSSTSLSAAAIAATLLTALAFILLRLVTRWDGLTAPRETEWE